MAWSSSSNRCTVTTGPNTSRWMISARWSTPAMTVGWMKNPGRSIRSPPVSTEAPPSRARDRNPMTRSKCSFDTTGPISVDSSSGSPTASDPTDDTSPSISESYTFGPASTRVAAVQSWPELK